MQPISIYWPVDVSAWDCFKNRQSTTVFRRVRFPGITRFAAAHGYNYVSVYRHLTGERPSKTIGRKWEAWQAAK